MPICPPDGLLLRVKVCAVCATDVKMYHHGHHLLKLPRVLGHEVAGVIETVGTAVRERFVPGERVAVCAVINCGQCRCCLQNHPSMCEELVAFGYHYDGGFQEFMTIPGKAVRCGGVNRLPDHVSFEEAAMAELLACSLNGQTLSGFSLGMSVLIIGAGTVGLIQARLAYLRGCNPIYLADIVPEKLEQARRLCRGMLTGTLDNRNTSLFVAEAQRITINAGFDQVMVCCGAPAAQQAALQLVGKCGCVNFFGGLPHGRSEVTLDTNLIHYKQARIVGTHGASVMDNRLALDLVAQQRIVIRDLITHRIQLEGLANVLQNHGGDPQCLKTVLEL